jgi:hypothetical protein
VNDTRDEIRDASIARIAAIFPDGDLAYLLARLTAAEADADRWERAYRLLAAEERQS